MAKLTSGRYPNTFYSGYAEEAAKQLGKEAIVMGYGDPAVGQQIVPGLMRRIAAEVSNPSAGAYTDQNGFPELVRAFKQYVRDDEELQSPFDLTVVTAGGRSGIYALAKVVEGDTVVVPNPCWSGYGKIFGDAGMSLYKVHTDESTLFVPQPEQVRAAIKNSRKEGKKPGMVVFNSPNNPTGSVYNRKCIEGNLDVLMEEDVMGFVDLTYRAIRPEGSNVPSILKIAEEKGPQYLNKLVAMQTLGKITKTPGLRVGYVMTTKEGLVGKISSAQQPFDLSGHLFLQKAWADYLGTEEQKEDFRKTVEEFSTRRAIVLKGMQKLNYNSDLGNIMTADVGFYLTFQIPKRFQDMQIPLSELDRFLKDHPVIEASGVTRQDYLELFEDLGFVPGSELYALELAEKTGVAVCPGHLFSRETDFQNWVRMALIQPKDNTKEALERIVRQQDVFKFK